MKTVVNDPPPLLGPGFGRSVIQRMADTREKSHRREVESRNPIIKLEPSEQYESIASHDGHKTEKDKENRGCA